MTYQRAQDRLGAAQLGTTLLKVSWMSWWTTRWTWFSSALLQQQRQIRSWAPSAEVLLAVIETWSSHSTQCLSDCIWNTVSSSRPHGSKKIQTGWKGFKGVPQRWSKGWRTCLMRKEWSSQVSCPWRREGSEGPHPSIPVLKGPLQEWSCSLNKEPHRADRKQWVQVTLEQVSSWYEKDFLLLWEQSITEPPQGCGRALITGGFQDVIGQDVK